MKVTTLLGLMALILVVMVSGAVGYVTFFVDGSGGGEAANGMSEQELIDKCSDVRDVTCREGSISEVEYPPNCFVDGEHVLDEPYSCPG